MPKTKTRDIARDLKLQVANKPDSQDICFVPNGNYKTIVEKLRPESFVEGEIVDTKEKYWENIVGSQILQ